MRFNIGVVVLRIDEVRFSGCNENKTEKRNNNVFFPFSCFAELVENKIFWGAMKILKLYVDVELIHTIFMYTCAIIRRYFLLFCCTVQVRLSAFSYRLLLAKGLPSTKHTDKMCLISIDIYFTLNIFLYS